MLNILFTLLLAADLCRPLVLIFLHCHGSSSLLVTGLQLQTFQEDPSWFVSYRKSKLPAEQVGYGGNPKLPQRIAYEAPRRSLVEGVEESLVDDEVARVATLDVVGLALKPSCVVRKAIGGLNTYMYPAPRTIYILTTNSSYCAYYSAMGPNVNCVLEKLSMAMSKDEVVDILVQQFQHIRGHAIVKGPWYYQQLLKLGSVHLPNISEYYVVWDMDMLLVNPYEVLRADTKTGGIQTKVNWGGVSFQGYWDSYKRLTGQDLELGPDNSSFVVHHMVVHRPRMMEFLHSITSESHRNQSLGWAHSILEAVNPTHLNTGFSEYWAYHSWLLQNHRDKVYLPDRVSWVRGPRSIKPLNVGQLYEGEWIPVCCPSFEITDMKEHGIEFFGYELAHHAHCHYDHPAFQYQYALWVDFVGT